MQYKLLWLSESFHPYGEIPSRKGKYLVLKTNTKPHQLIKDVKISYCIVSLVFRKCSCGAYRNGLNWGTSKLRDTPSTTKGTNRVSLIPFVTNPHFSILLRRVWCLKNLFMSRREQVIIFPGWVYNPKLRARVHKQLFSFVCQRYDFRKTKIWRQTSWKWTNLWLTLNRWRWTNL